MPHDADHNRRHTALDHPFSNPHQRQTPSPPSPPQTTQRTLAGATPASTPPPKGDHQAPPRPGANRQEPSAQGGEPASATAPPRHRATAPPRHRARSEPPSAT